MKKCLFFTMAMLFALTAPLNMVANASTTADTHADCTHDLYCEFTGHTDADDNSAARRVMCSNCWSSIEMVAMCADVHTYTGTGTHKYGLFWSETCTFDTYSSRAGYVCTVCLFVDWFDGEHHCLEIHQDCGRGNDLWCPFGGPVD